MVFIECDAHEIPGSKSKVNNGQAELCAHVCKLLCTPAAAEALGGNDNSGKAEARGVEEQSIAVLTPYARQVEVLKKLLAGLASDVEVSSIDSFQGREAEIAVFVSVRCNELQDIGFLNDLRRMNVALTRARAGLIVIGNRATLTQGTADAEATAMWARLLDGLVPVPMQANVEVQKQERRQRLP